MSRKTWHQVPVLQPGRHFYGDRDADYAWVGRNQDRPRVWDAHVYEYGVTTFPTLAAAKKWCEVIVRSILKVSPTGGTGT